MVARGLFDVAIVTGDEYCSKLVKNDAFDFRNYYSDTLMSATGIEYIPLGPRVEFERVPFEEMKRVNERTYVFNFVGSLSSDDRRVMVKFWRMERSRSGT